MTTTTTKTTRKTARLGLVSAGAALGTAALVLATPLAASAHVGVTPSSTAAGSSTVLTFSIPHGCDGASTTQLTFEIPDRISSVTPTVNPNWTIEKVSEGDRVSSVVYTAVTPLDDGYRDAVELSLHLPEDAEGETIAFPVTQTCEVGEIAWTEIAGAGEDPHDLESPAPAITVTAAEDDAHSHHTAPADDGAAATDDAAAATVVDASDPLARGLGAAGVVLGAAAVVLLSVLLLRRGSSGRTSRPNTED
ncbi:hypothetical protein GCM10027416_00110 [Okibacterium endophyticum]